MLFVEYEWTLTSYSTPCSDLTCLRSDAKKWQVEQCLIRMGEFAWIGSPRDSNQLFGSTPSISQVVSYVFFVEALTC